MYGIFENDVFVEWVLVAVVVLSVLVYARYRMRLCLIRIVCAHCKRCCERMFVCVYECACESYVSIACAQVCVCAHKNTHKPNDDKHASISNMKRFDDIHTNSKPMDM